jgi:predicted SprT family Zn-dependent metalloprotease
LPRRDPPELRTVFDRLNALHFGGSLRATLEWSTRMTRAAGRCFHREEGPVIRIALRYVEKFPAQLERLMLHEMIHIVARGHGRAFKAEARRCGVEPDRDFIHCREFTPPAPPRYVYVCPACGRKHHLRRRGRWACGVCYRRTGRRYALRPISAPGDAACVAPREDGGDVGGGEGVGR